MRAQKKDGMQDQSAEDLRWMQRALQLAARGTALAAPNPLVGCVLVHNGQAVGEGWHEYDRRDHAEAVALKQAGNAARGATAYVTLEPCSHTGRTGPCADKLLAAGVSRVVAATVDPNPQVAGSGLERLRSHGVAISTGVLGLAAQRQNLGFARHITSGLPFVTLKVALSSDGAIAPAPAHRTDKAPFWITGEQARAEVQTMRHQSDALLTGIGTVLADDPAMTDRTGRPRRRRLLRVVLDSRLRLPLGAKILEQPEDLLVFAGPHASQEQEQRLIDLGVTVERVETRVAQSQEELDLPTILKRLGERNVLNLMIEAGQGVNSALVQGNLVDATRIFCAPVELGRDAIRAFRPGTSPHASHAGQTEATVYGADIATWTLLHDPWRQEF